MPVLLPGDPLLSLKTEIASSIMKRLAALLVSDSSPLLSAPPAGAFQRVILAVEDPTLREGAEILVAKWGEGFTSPVHGHAAGLLHEEILAGQMLVHTYRHTSPGTVRPLRTDIASPGTLVSKYSPPDPRGDRMGLVHNFTAITPAISLHFVPEHTRDGRDNRFEVEHFTDLDRASVQQLDGNGGRLLQIGEVALVRSDNVREYGDHFIVVTGSPVLKPHGLRPQDVAILAGPEASALLDSFAPTGNTGLRLLKLNNETARKFREFHGITIAERVVVFPEP
jgi:predicted metal-dependent enzyme (double-stranded beta helix superfamily)